MCYVLDTCVTLPTPLVDKFKSETSSAASYGSLVIYDLQKERDSEKLLVRKELVS
jgi:hypothetical protein